MSHTSTGVSDFYDVLADDYDELAVKAPKYFVPQWIAAHAHQLESLRDCRVLDLGCGTGLNVKLLREHHAGIRADGVDISSQMLKHARASNTYESLSIHDLHIPLLDIPSDRYDLVIVFGVLEFLSDVNTCLSECRRALKVNGKLWASFQRFEPLDPSSPPQRRVVRGLVLNGYSAAQIRHMMRAADMQVTTLEPLPGYITDAGVPCPYYVLQAQKMVALAHDATISG